MTRNQIKLVYSKKYNQYYKPIRFREDTKVCEVVLYTKKKDKNEITKLNIASYEDDTDWTFVIMQNNFETAENYFIKAINGTDYKATRKALKHFIANGLTDSKLAMNELVKWYNIGFTDTRSQPDTTTRKRIQSLYNNICTCDTKNVSFKGYKQHIPIETRNLGYKKGLIIERNDDYYYNNLNQRKAATGKKKEELQQLRDCGYRIVNTQGRILCGDGYSMCDAQVIEFVEKYNPVPEDLSGDYKVSLTKNQEEKISKVEKFLKAHKFAVKSKNNLRFWITTANGHVVYGGENGMAYGTFLRRAYILKDSKGWK